METAETDGNGGNNWWKASRMGGAEPHPPEGQNCFTCENELDRFTSNNLE